MIAKDCFRSPTSYEVKFIQRKETNDQCFSQFITELQPTTKLACTAHLNYMIHFSENSTTATLLLSSISFLVSDFTAAPLVPSETTLSINYFKIVQK